LSLAMTRSQFGDVNIAMPSRYLQEIPAELIDWRQSPGMANSRGGTEPRALNARRGGFGIEASAAGPGRIQAGSITPGGGGAAGDPWKSRVTSTVRDNGDLTLEVGERINHSDFGDGTVTAVTGVGPKSVAEVQFDSASRKRLLIKIAPISKIQ
ncbi:MAG: ATP-dependent DNA helicase PcrA, partial [Cryobacterium sp.]|nr:ATP-dependent DNA helicase PcrA [Cryobacterium sp.]